MLHHRTKQIKDFKIQLVLEPILYTMESYNAGRVPTTYVCT
jgi:hypothetical protein